MITATVDMSGFNAAAQQFVTRLGINSKVVLRKEAGEMMKTLVKVTPPSNPTKTRQNIEKGVRSKFSSAGTASGHAAESESLKGSGDINWYNWTKHFLYGVAAEKDMRKASPNDIYKLNWTLTPKGRQRLEFRHSRRQKILLSQKVLTTDTQINRLIARLRRHVGRLKAGWLVGWDALSPSGSNMPPQWVMRHKEGARGRYVNELGNESRPSITIANSAKGITDKQVNRLVALAVAIRSKAMAGNLKMILSGKKALSQYA